MTSRPVSSNFRRWLITKLAETQFVVKRGESDEDLGKRIGVQASVVKAAREYNAQTRPGRTFGEQAAKKNTSYLVYLEPPPVIYEEWMAHCERVGLTNMVLLRSVVHHMLQKTSQPDWLTLQRTQWPWKGKWLKQSLERGRGRLKTQLNEAAFRALDGRAIHTRTTTNAIARWGVIMLLTHQIRGLRIVGLSGLFTDPAQYCVTPKVED